MHIITQLKLKPVDIKSNIYIDSSKDINDKNPKFKIGDNVRISKYKNICAKGYTQNWSEVFVIKKVKNTVLQTYVINILKEKKLLESFLKTNCEKHQKQFWIEKVIKRKGNKLYVK